MANPNVGVFDQIEANRLSVERSQVLGVQVEKANIPLVESARSQSIQERGKRQDSTIVTNIASMFQAADTLPPWWSAYRDQALYDLWHVSDLLGGAMYAMASKMSTIPFHIEARDMSVTAHLQDAERFERKLQESSEWGTGWGQFFSKQVESLLGQDNGRFMEIIDMSPKKAQAIRGPAISVATLDPSRCTRTSDPVFPVLYRRTDGKMIMLHWTRVAFEAQLPSSRVDMYGVGLSAVSRSAGYARRMLDIAKYNEEKLGSRPMRGIITVGGGLDPEKVGEALSIASELTDSKGLQRFQYLPIVGSADIEEPTVELISLSSLPDGFDEQESTEVAMAAIALAFGVDARELWPGQTSASTRADALLSHIKQRGKGPGHILLETERMFNNWYLPPYLKMVFDFQDDAQDRQKAEIRNERSKTRKSDIEDQISDIRTERERMLVEGEIQSAQFEQLELSDGRLPDGTPIQVLFYRDDEIYSDILSLPGLSDPLDFRANDPDKALDAIAPKLSEAYELLASESRQIQKRQIQQSIAALLFIQEEYEELAALEAAEELALAGNQSLGSSIGNSNTPKKTPSNPESESAINKRPDDEENLAALENSPREFKKDTLIPPENPHSDLVTQIFQEERELRIAQEIAKAKKPPVINFHPTINVPEDLPQSPPDVNVLVEPAQIIVNPPNVTVESPNINVEAAPTPNIILPEQTLEIEVNPTPIEVSVESPNVEVRPEISINNPAPIVAAPTKEKQAPKYEVIDIERDAGGSINRVRREQIDKPASRDQKNM